MATLSSTKFLAIFLLLAISAFASASETAFFSLNRFQLRQVRERHRSAYNRIRTLMGRPSRLLVLILVLNEVVNLSISGFVTAFLERHLPLHLSAEKEWYVVTLASMAITIPLLLIIGEITPKLVATKMNRIVAIVSSRILVPVYRLLFPVLWLVDASISFALRRLKAEGRDHLSKTMSILSEDDFMALMEEGHREGTVDPGERKLITNVLEFDDSTVAEVMTPIAQVFCVSANARITDVLPEIRGQKYSRIPVYHRSRRNIGGILYVKDLLALREPPGYKDLDVKSVMTRAMFVGPRMRLSVLFRRFKDSKTHMAIVVDEALGDDAIGVVTMEDVLESIFGEIADERDVQ